jgi:hypothetical protein
MLLQPTMGLKKTLKEKVSFAHSRKKVRSSQAAKLVES